ncbi:uncharacterized protein [Spinacia oleracea]|uniref:Uncharacterized protein n=1 Tax=Spinacia oleracea TaxID=3562 RepID=A0ABM3QWI3_SPIOL|nr:uncharacterized protein LOC130462803 [Spinacia oleracea]
MVFKKLQPMIGIEHITWNLGDACVGMVDHHPKQKTKEDGGILCMVLLLSSVEVVTAWMKCYKKSDRATRKYILGRLVCSDNNTIKVREVLDLLGLQKIYN